METHDCWKHKQHLSEVERIILKFFDQQFYCEIADSHLPHVWPLPYTICLIYLSSIAPITCQLCLQLAIMTASPSVATGICLY